MRSNIIGNIIRRDNDALSCCQCGFDLTTREADNSSFEPHPECGPCNHDRCNSCGIRIGKHHTLVPNKLVEVILEYNWIKESKNSIEERSKIRKGPLRICKFCYKASFKRTLVLNVVMRA